MNFNPKSLLNLDRLTHGMSNSREYEIWSGMKKRCMNQNDRLYKWYGGRGITVCARWIDSFESFLADMGRCPAGLSIERKNNSRGYEPGNCIWADKETQSYNRRDNRWITWKGETLALSQWQERTGIPRRTIHNRLKHGYSVEQALSVRKYSTNGKPIAGIDYRLNGVKQEQPRLRVQLGAKAKPPEAR